MENKFKPGDKVCRKLPNGKFKAGDIVTVHKYFSDGSFSVTEDHDGPTHHDEYCDLIVPKVQKESNKGLRYNTDKLRWRNFPIFLMKPMIEVAQYGESKYDTYNFLKGQTISDSLDSLKRHLELLESPYESDEDKESGVNHLAHIAWNALVALHMLSVRPDLDDRYTATPEEIELYQKAKEAQKRGR